MNAREPERDPDLAWVQSLQRGDDTALDVLMGRYRHRVFAFIYRHVANVEDAQELTQETFVRAYFHVRQFKPNALFSTWLFRIALNLCRDHARSKAYRQGSRTESLDAPPQGESTSPSRDVAAEQNPPDKDLASREELAAAKREIEKLPPELKEAFILHVIEQRPQDEVATLLGVTRKAVETRVYRARKAIEKALSRM